MTKRDDDESEVAREEETPRLTLGEEVASVTTREVLAGRVRLSTRVEHVEEIARAALRTEGVEVSRVAIDRVVDAVPPIRTEGDVTIVPVVEEIMVVETRLVLKEEWHLRKTVRTDIVEQPVALRRQTAVVERIDGAGHHKPAG